MARFFVKPSDINSGSAVLAGEDAAHIFVLRESVGSQVILCDGEGTDYECTITALNRKNNEVALRVDGSHPTESEPRLRITLYQGLPKSDKMEFIIQKCVELGVYEIVPVETERSVARANEKSTRKIERWQKISESAAKQCGRGIIPRVRSIMSFEDAISSAEESDRAYIAYERQICYNAAEEFSGKSDENVAIFIGPEGGFSQDEIDLATTHGLMPVSLGRRILRTETAGLTAVILLLFVHDDL